MTTVSDRKPDAWPTTRSAAATFLFHASEYMKELAPCYLPGRPNVLEHGTYDDRKSATLLEAMGDLILAQLRIEAWFVDLGFNGCQIDDDVDEVAMMKLDEPVSAERLAWLAECARQSKIADGTLQIEDSSIGGIPCISSQETS